MLLTRELADEMSSRIKIIKRTNPNVFFTEINSELNSPVNLFDAFQSWDDFHNDLRKIFIAPLVNSYLSAKYDLKLALDLSILTIDLMTISPSQVIQSSFNVVVDVIDAIFYAINATVATVTLPAAFALRCLITIAEYFHNLFIFGPVPAAFEQHAIPVGDDIEMPLHRF